MQTLGEEATVERFVVTQEVEGLTIPSHIFLVKDSLTGRIREVTDDFADASAVAAWLNAERTYTGDCTLVVA